jgi:hypothetical protein
MAHFYGDLQGNRGQTTRCGAKSSGIDAHLRGWNIGVQVTVQHEDGHDTVYVYRTCGSNGGYRTLIAKYTADTPIASIPLPALETAMGIHAA